MNRKSLFRGFVKENTKRISSPSKSNGKLNRKSFSVRKRQISKLPPLLPFATHRIRRGFTRNKLQRKEHNTTNKTPSSNREMLQDLREERLPRSCLKPNSSSKLKSSVRGSISTNFSLKFDGQNFCFGILKFICDCRDMR